MLELQPELDELGYGVVAVGFSPPEALAALAEHQVRRLPVVDGHELVGMLAQADVARSSDDGKFAKAVERTSED